MDDKTMNSEYTLVLGKDYIDAEHQAKTAFLKADLPKEEHTERESGDPKEAELRDRKESIDRLYYDYERMCLKQPGIIDKDDAYPHSYYWRLGDRYDPGKVAALEEALKSGGKIENTEAYEKYVEEVKGRKYSPVSWD